MVGSREFDFLRALEYSSVRSKNNLMRKVKWPRPTRERRVKDFLIELAEAKIQELERKRILPQSKG